MSVLTLAGPLSAREVEQMMLLLATDNGHYELVDRTWLDADRCYFLRWRRTKQQTPAIIGLLNLSSLPSNLSRVELLPFDHNQTAAARQALERYANLLQAKLVPHSFAEQPGAD